MLCGEFGCVRVKGHPSFHTTTEAIARRVDSEHSLSALVGAVASRQRTDEQWKRDSFGGWDANGAPASNYPGPEVQ